MAKPIPDGYHSITPHVVVKNAPKAIEFYKKAFGAEELARMPMPDGRIMHAELKIGDSVVMLAEEFPEMGMSCRSPETLGGCTATLHVYTPDVDGLFKRAVDAGASVVMPPQDMFWGDRYGKLTDPFGVHWSVATHKEDLSPDEIGRRQAAFMKQMAGAKGC